MGVHNLWALLLPISRRVSIETLTNKVLAVDASIWLVQFVKAMRDSEGNMNRNAHLLGTLRRILKLLFHHIQPIFVFDGSTPAIKLQELRARRDRREKQDVSVKRTAKRLLVAKLKEGRLLEEEKRRSSANANNNDKGAFASGFVDGDDGDDGGEVDGEKEETSKITENITEKKDKPSVLNVDDDMEDVFDNDSNSDEEVNWEDSDTEPPPQWDTQIPTSSLDMSVLPSLPPSLRSDVISKAKAAARVRSRKEYMPVAADPGMYSEVQLRNFLRSSRFNKSVEKLAKEEVNELEGSKIEGSIVASDASKRIVVKNLQPGIEWGENGSSGSDTDDEEPEEEKLQKEEEEKDDEAILEDWARTTAEKASEFSVDDCGVLNDDYYTGSTFDDKDKEGEDKSDDGQDALARVLKKTRQESSVLSVASSEDSVDESPSVEELRQNVLPSSPPSSLDESSGSDDNISWEIDSSLPQPSSPPYISSVPPSHDNHISAPQATAFAEAAADAGRLTSWAGRAVKRAIKQHIDEVTGGRRKEEVEVEEEVEEDIMRAIEISKAEEREVEKAIELSREGGGEEDREVEKAIELSREEREVERAIEISRKELDDKDDDDDDEIEVIQPLPPPPTATSAAATTTTTAAAAAATTTTTTSSVTTTTTTTTNSTSTKIKPRKSANPKNASTTDTTSEDRLRQEELVRLAAERGALQSQLNRHQRDTDNVTDEMRDEVIELLQLFGLPYVIAPAEAESQCVELERNGLVDGIITEDSDVFVFGGQAVYRNIFDERKYVEVYFGSDAKNELGLERHHFVALAMLLGGDYTQGVRGVGIVNGMEILSAFPVDEDPTEGLKKFKTWLDGFDPLDMLKGTDVSDMMTEERRFHQKHKSARNRWDAPPNFPAKEAVHAYMRPVVDTSARPFQWGYPDVNAIEILCANKLGWTLEECDRQLKPVIEKMNETSRQTRMENFFTTYEDRDLGGVVKSKRLRSVLKRKVGAVAGVCGDDEENGGEDGGEDGGRKKKRKETKTKKPRAKTAYTLFGMSERKKVAREFPDLKFGEITKEVAKRWKAMHDRRVWVEMARKEKEKLQGGNEGEVEDVVEVPVDGKGGDEDEDGESDGYFSVADDDDDGDGDDDNNNDNE
ncbi:hypothetical protein TrVE_jg3825 [Triparma verrucosa]|uniref:HMG box domain-containing protein n=1 Tax=Triparma verrucosa TaxID=1606542 RepID=A0A9W7F6M3_9STRA|nr:hypothetical protein TrVE_jg3825 [Triparma verrucosa]